MSTTNLLSEICSEKRGINVKTLEKVIYLAVEIAREGNKVGTLFVISDSEEVMKRSRCMILDPLILHPDYKKNIEISDMRETIKELSQLDGAFIVSDEGIVISACRYINSSNKNINLPLCLGSRHMAAASISRETNAVSVVVSESSVVRIFDDGEIVSEIIPELRLLQHHSLHLRGPYSEKTDKDLTVVSKK